MRTIEAQSICADLRFSNDELVDFFRCLDSLPMPERIIRGELSVAFVDRETIARLHDEFLGDPNPTDVITFPGDEEADFAGEICVCPDIARESATRLREPLARELVLYLVHGWLHLAGHRDDTETGRNAMREAEARILGMLEEAGKIPSFS